MNKKVKGLLFGICGACLILPSFVLFGCSNGELSTKDIHNQIGQILTTCGYEDLKIEDKKEEEKKNVVIADADYKKVFEDLIMDEVQANTTQERIAIRDEVEDLIVKNQLAQIYFLTSLDIKTNQWLEYNSDTVDYRYFVSSKDSQINIRMVKDSYGEDFSNYNKITTYEYNIKYEDKENFEIDYVEVDRSLLGTTSSIGYIVKNGKNEKAGYFESFTTYAIVDSDESIETSNVTVKFMDSKLEKGLNKLILSNKIVSELFLSKNFGYNNSHLKEITDSSIGAEKFSEENKTKIANMLNLLG